MSTHHSTDHPDPWRQSVSEDLRELKDAFKELAEKVTDTRMTAASTVKLETMNATTTVRLEAVKTDLEIERNIRRDEVQRIRDDLTVARATMNTLKWVAAAFGVISSAAWAVFLFVAKQ